MSGKRGTLDLSTVFDAVDIPTAILDAEGSVVVWNRALEALLDIDREEVRGLDDIGERVYDGDRRTILAEKVLRHPRTADEVYDIGRADSEYALLDVDGQPTYEDTSTVTGGSGADIWFLATPLYDGEEFLGVVEFVQQRSDSERRRREMERLIDELNETLSAFRDGEFTARAEYDSAESILEPDDIEVLDGVNELARMRQALREQVTKTEEARRELERQNERLERFAGVVAHDLRNPLTVASGHAGHLVDAGDELDGEEVVASGERIARALGRMESLIDDMLALSRQGRVVDDPEPVALETLIHESWSSVPADGASLDVDSLPGTVEADEERLRTVFENLFRNCIEHCAEEAGGDEVTVWVGSLSEGGIYIEDDGSGIALDDRQDVFEYGYSSDEDGTGLGLSIVEAIVSAHGWDIAATGGRDGGARFEIRFDGS